MSDKDERKKKRHRAETKVRVAVILIPIFLIFIAWGGFAYAKYYAKSYQSGVAVASGVYFTANYAVATEESEKEFFEYIVSNGYMGIDYNFDFEVRNYENSMLFNESTVTIPYSLDFWLEEEPVGATYTVTYNGEVKTLQAGEDNKVGYSLHSIAGGKAMANKYNILIDVEDESAGHDPVAIYVEVRTEEGAMISSVLRGKMILRAKERPESYIESQQFIVSSEATTDEEKFTELKKLSAFTYEIKTVGEVYTGDEITEELKLSWDPTVLEIDLYNDNYLDWLERSKESGPLTDEKGWNYIIIEAMPYSAVTINFFRGKDFDTITTWEAISNSILAEKVQETNEGTGE